MTDTYYEDDLSEHESDLTLPYTAYSESLQPKRLPPSRKNLAKNPSMVDPVNVHYDSVQAGFSADTEVSWVGSTSLRLTITTAGSSVALSIDPDPESRIDVTAGTEYVTAVRVVANPANPNRAFRAELRWYNASDVQVGSTTTTDYKKITTSGWTLLTTEGVVAPVGATYLIVTWRPAHLADIDLGIVANTVGDIFYFDGLDVHEGILYDGVYVDGDQPACAWDGTPHASTSTRTVPANRELPRSEQAPFGRYLRGFGGSFIVRPHVFRADINNRRLEDISEAFISGQVRASEENEGSMWSFTGEFTDPIDLEPYVDFVAPFLRLEYANGKIVDDGSGFGVQMGLYQVVPPKKTVTWEESRYQMDGRDLLWMLSRRRYAGVETEPVGVVLTDRVVARLEALGFPRHVIQHSARTGGRVRTYDVAASGVEVCNEMLNAIGFYGLTPDRLGRLTSFQQIDMMKREPNAIFLDGEDGAVLEPYDVQPETEIFNQVTVYKDDKETPFRFTATNNDPTSPTRVSRIGLHAMPPVNFSDAETQADVEAEAWRLLREKSSVMLSTKLRTMPQPWHNLREVYYLHLKQSSGASVDEAYGRYWCKGWTLTFDQREAAMEHDLYKLIAFDDEV